MSARATWRLTLAFCASFLLAPGAVRGESGDAPCKDAVITRIVEARLAVDREIGQFRIGVATNECVVTLSGCVESREQAKKAKELAKRLIKVKVNNELTVCTIAPRKAKIKKPRS